ncbi:hypothetical protein CIK60_18780 [Brevibacterium aurantiacum]|nr:hypothetical protein CIK60_18780 [Brevibacterium aurantiacum]
MSQWPRGLVLVLLAVLLLIAGPSVISFANFECRGIIGWSLVFLGAVLGIAGAIRGRRVNGSVDDDNRSAS